MHQNEYKHSCYNWNCCLNRTVILHPPKKHTFLPIRFKNSTAPWYKIITFLTGVIIVLLGLIEHSTFPVEKLRHHYNDDNYIKILKAYVKKNSTLIHSISKTALWNAL